MQDFWRIWEACFIDRGGKSEILGEVEMEHMTALRAAADALEM